MDSGPRLTPFESSTKYFRRLSDLEESWRSLSTAVERDMVPQLKCTPCDPQVEILLLLKQNVPEETELGRCDLFTVVNSKMYPGCNNCSLFFSGRKNNKANCLKCHKPCYYSGWEREKIRTFPSWLPLLPRLTIISTFGRVSINNAPSCSGRWGQFGYSGSALTLWPTKR